MSTCSTSLRQCLQAIARFQQCPIGAPADAPITWGGLLAEAMSHGLVGQYRQCAVGALSKAELPAIALGKDGQGFILAAVREGEVLVHYPASGRSETWPLSQLADRWSGQLLVLQSARAAMGGLARFDFTWFIPALIEHRKWLGQVLLAALALQVFALVSPLFFQAVMDKVLLHRTLHTLDW